MASSTPRVFNIPASVPFLSRLIEALVEGRLVPGFNARDPLSLTAATLYLPTRRACRLARDLFLDALPSDAAILPRILAIGDVDEDEIAFAEAAMDEFSAGALDLPKAIGGFERRVALAQMVIKWANSPGMRGAAGAPLIASSPAAALALADDLARLMDDMTTRQVPWDKFDGLVPGELDEFWQRTLRFLNIARETWPTLLAERGAIEPAARRDMLIAAEAKRLGQINAPVIAAGSTGSMPATAMLLATIAKLPHGAVVLPGLDTDLDEASWETIAGEDVTPAPGHPQFAMHALLKRIGIARGAVETLTPAAAHGREFMVSEALRPAATTEHWHQRLATPVFAKQADAAMASLAVVEAANAEEEALAIAVALRQTYETPDATAALVTPDRALARRVGSALARWQIQFDDSGGDSLADTSAGVFARLGAEAALGGLAPVGLLALLKHPLLRLGANEGDHAHAIATLERAILRGPRPRPGSGGLGHALASFRAELEKLRRKEASELHRSDPRANLTDAELDAAAALVKQLTTALKPLESIGKAPRAFAEIGKHHRDVAAELSTGADGVSAAFSGTAGVRLVAAFDDIELHGKFEVAKADYAELFHAAIADRVVRRPEAADVRIRIFGPLESRLQNIDRMVLGGLAEGVWPPEARSDPWLSRPMRQQLGLDPPERRIGLSAHDFAQALGAKQVILTRAAKIAGAPTVMSRFVQRLAAVAGEKRWREARERGENYLALARSLDTPASPPKPAARPEPRPPLAARPLALSVTAIEDWLRDPYTIYAKHILRLMPLDAVDTPPGARDRGTVIHEAIGEFTQKFAGKLPADPAGELIALGRKHFAALEDYPEAQAFWWPRFERIANWFAGWELERRENIAALHAEIRGEISIPLGKREFKLSARADRIERRTDGNYAILDYKTGRVPGHDEVKVGFAPQLTLEAAILRAGGFPEIPRGASVSELVYVSLKGDAEGGEEKQVKLKDTTADDVAGGALEKLRALALRFEDEKQAYASLMHPMWKTRYGDYDHLARVKEWSLSGGADSDEGGGE